MARTPTASQPDSVIEHDGMLWRPKRGATATAEEFITARTRFTELLHESGWNPWVLDDRKAEYVHAVQVIDQWKRADPGHGTLTQKQVEILMAKRDRETEQELAEHKKERAVRAAHYSPKRAEARSALAEHQSRLPHELGELARFRDGSAFPLMDWKRRQEEITKLEESIEHRRGNIGRLATIVGNPEEVVDEHGWLPRERRELMLTHYKYERETKVRKLREALPELEAELRAATDRNERRELRGKTAPLRRRLDNLVAIPPLTPNDMCSDCPTPMSKHGWVTPPFEGPCPAWPGWAARLRQAREILESASREAQAQAEPPARKPEPLATIPSGLPIAEMMQRLSKLQEKHPDAEVRRGRANRLELW
ncbi:hypothetical protein ACAG26_01280 [Mycobacterium sp. pUA109]|uniref:hypothetical protein n=1 Tax=Mycobacterium sp. pUA109 TaxID=3238982 RepID=UPI00351B2FB5